MSPSFWRPYLLALLIGTRPATESLTESQPSNYIPTGAQQGIRLLVPLGTDLPFKYLLKHLCILAHPSAVRLDVDREEKNKAMVLNENGK